MQTNWKTIGESKRYGVSIPLYALHSKTTYGIGEYGELIKLFPWLSSMGFSVVQLQPVFDTAGLPDPHLPYSAFALNPLFLSLTEIPHSSDKEDLYMQKTISYSSASKFKETLLIKFYYDHGEMVGKSDAFLKFCEENPWLDDYVGLKGRDPKYHQFVQFLCHQQLKQVKAEAEKHGILLMVEIPTKLQANSPDVKYHPNWFTIVEETAECNWEEMKRDDYSWWKERLQNVSNYFDCCHFDQPVDSEDFFAQVSNDLSMLLILNEKEPPTSGLNNTVCPTLTYPNSEQYPDHSLTTLARPTRSISPDQHQQLIKQSLTTPSRLHLVPLTTYLSLVPSINWTSSEIEDADRWSLSIRPSVEKIISDPQLREAIEACLA